MSRFLKRLPAPVDPKCDDKEGADPDFSSRQSAYCCAPARRALAVLTPAGSSAAITTFGSPLAVPATLNTAENLNYLGTNTYVPPSPEAPTACSTPTTTERTRPCGAWPRRAAAPRSRHGPGAEDEAGGLRRADADGPAPLTQIHFQSLSPLPGGGAKVNLTSQPFDIPVCG